MVSSWRSIRKSHAQFENCANKLPTTRDALYEIAFLQPEELRLCLENRYTRSSVTQPEAEWKRPTKPQPVINPGASAGSIRSWRKNWREPRHSSIFGVRSRRPRVTFFLTDNQSTYIDMVLPSLAISNYDRCEQTLICSTLRSENRIRTSSDFRARPRPQNGPPPKRSGPIKSDAAYKPRSSPKGGKRGGAPARTVLIPFRLGPFA